MLALTVRAGDKVTVGPTITITVLRHSDGQVRIGIEAPTDLDIQRHPGKGNPPQKKERTR